MEKKFTPVNWNEAKVNINPQRRYLNFANGQWSLSEKKMDSKED